MGEVAEPWLQPMLARAIGVATDHHRAHVVVQHLVRRAAEERKRRLVAGHQRLQPLVGDELNIGHPAVTQHSNEHRQRIRAAAHNSPVDLHLPTRRGLEPNNRVGHFHRSQGYQVLTQDGDPAGVATQPQFAQKHRCGNAVGMGRGHTARQKHPVGV